MKTNTNLGRARPFWLPSDLNIGTLTNNLGFLYLHVMSKMTINKQNVHYTNVHFDQPAGLHRWHGTSESGRKNSLVGPVVSSTHFSPLDRVITQDMAGTNSLQRLVISKGYGNRVHLSHMPLILNSSPTLGTKSVTQ